MPRLSIDLQEGFSGDDVIVRVNGEEVARQSGVRTKQTLGLAHSLAIAVPDGPVRVEVDVPTRGLRGSTDVRHAQLGVSLADVGVRFVQSDEEFGYG
jgi:hypothetical protein